MYEYKKLITIYSSAARKRLKEQQYESIEYAEAEIDTMIDHLEIMGGIIKECVLQIAHSDAHIPKSIIEFFGEKEIKEWRAA